MKKYLFVFVALMVLGTLILTSCGSDSAEGPAVPAAYAGKENPFSGDAAAIEAGKKLYDARCASCHGTAGGGDGPAAASLDPKPSALNQGQAADYLFYRISEGGGMAPFNSSMPASKGILSDDEIWQLVEYIQTF